MMTLAGHLGRTVEELEDGSAMFLPLSEREFQRWVALDSISPLGPERDDVRTAKITQAVFTGPLKTPPALDDPAVMLQWDTEAAEQDRAEKLRRKFLGRANPGG